MESATFYRFFGIAVILLFLMGANALRALGARAQASANPQLLLANVASALGMQIVRGDPSFHFAVGPSPVLWAMLFGMQILRYDVRLEGQAGPRALAFAARSYHARLRARTFTLYEKAEFDARMTIGGVSLPSDFEAVLVPSSPYLAAQASAGLPPVHRGPTPQGELIVTGADAAALAPLLPVIGQFASIGYVHLVGRGHEIHFVLTETALASLAAQLPTIREGLVALASAADPAPRT